MFICLKRVDISMMLMGDAGDVIEYGGRTPELSNAPLHMKHDNDSLEKFKVRLTYEPPSLHHQSRPLELIYIIFELFRTQGLEIVI